MVLARVCVPGSGAVDADQLTVKSGHQKFEIFLVHKCSKHKVRRC